jgi:hypothetical protein
MSIIDNDGTLSIDESTVLINYVLSPNQNFIINNDLKVNTVSLDYYATADIVPDEVYNYSPITANTDFTSKQPTIERVIVSSTETSTS